MRLVILDDRTSVADNEQAALSPPQTEPVRRNENLCQIPEFVGKKEGRHRVEDGRNCTCCPFIFSSREDLVDGVGGWPPGALTCHEVFHGVDMAIRQKDPAFHWKVADAYERHKARGTLGSIYASTNRDEYMAEMVVVYCGLSTDELTEVGLRDRQTLRDMAPEAFALIEGYIANSQ
ncbi:Uncharacterized protein PBTT_00433 [Plasmodiophora brassicae]|uniref:Uncharacterized protein n=1 Tax=Plasmodiophora brassicae TaxID=37360 RepID=A0A0G4ILV2_PLABS|nr:hypothetical protein PBRA_004762 [Plasmodiophora brassicae]